MNNRILLVGGLTAAALACIAASRMGDASPKLKAFANALSAAPSFSAKYTVQPLGGSATEYSVAFGKPNKARIETAEELTVADGQTITVYNKKDNSFYKKPQTEGELMGLFTSVETSVWKAFFKPEAVNGYTASKDSGTKQRAGKTLNVVDVQADPKGDLKLRLYTDATDNSLRQGEIVLANPGRDPQTSVLLVTETAGAADDVFAFKAPSGAKEVDMNAVASGVWLTDFDKALSLAKASGKLLMVDFMATWCGPCKMMDAEVFHSEKFKSVAKDFILCKVDVDAQKSIAQRYNISAMPTVKFIRGDGSVAHEFVGYGGPDQVYGEIDKAKGMK